MAIDYGKNNRKTIFGSSQVLTQEEEIELAHTIQKGKEYINSDKDLSQEEETLRKESMKASERLVSSYSYLIEKIAEEKFYSSGPYGVTMDDYISEAYITALQCTLTFNPLSSKTQVIRFSAYAPRAISSVLSRMSMRSRSLVSVPTTVMSDARKWSHTKFDLENKGIRDISDEDISAISGVSSSQQEIQSVLGLSKDNPLDDIIPPSITDKINIRDENEEKHDIINALKEVFDTEEELYFAFEILGIETGVSLPTPFHLSANTQGDPKKTDEFIKKFSGIMNHPHTRVKLENILNNRENNS